MDKIREALEYAAEWHSDCYYTQEKAKEALALISESKNSDAQDLALELAYGIWEPNTLYEGARNAWLRDAYAIIERCFAERERKARGEEREACAERAEKYIDSTHYVDIEYGRDRYDVDLEDLRAAIKED